jgi:hypothetical protein
MPRCPHLRTCTGMSCPLASPMCVTCGQRRSSSAMLSSCASTRLMSPQLASTDVASLRAAMQSRPVLTDATSTPACRVRAKKACVKLVRQCQCLMQCVVRMRSWREEGGSRHTLVRDDRFVAMHAPRSRHTANLHMQPPPPSCILTRDQQHVPDYTQQGTMSCPANAGADCWFACALVVATQAHDMASNTSSNGARCSGAHGVLIINPPPLCASCQCEHNTHSSVIHS